MPIASDPGVVNATERYPGCAVQNFHGKMTLLLNPDEPLKIKFFSFQVPKGVILLRKFDVIKVFADSNGATTPEGCEVFDHKKHKMLLLNPNEQPRIQFGLDKAKLFVQKIQAIRNFLTIYGGKVVCDEFNIVQPT